MKLDFTDRHIVVTGGTGALGSAVVETLIAAGATCHVPAHGNSQTAKNPRINVVGGVDLTNESAVEKFYAALPELWASVHTAGGFAAGKIEQTSLQTWQQQMQINATTCFLCCREAVKKIRQGKVGGRIVNVASKPALIATAGLSAYAASKAAVVSLTQTLSEELAAEKIWVNSVVPSIMDTPVNRKAMPKADFSKWPKVEEVAATIAFLASPQNLVTRGSETPVFGQS